MPTISGADSSFWLESVAHFLFLLFSPLFPFSAVSSFLFPLFFFLLFFSLLLMFLPNFLSGLSCSFIPVGIPLPSLPQSDLQPLFLLSSCVEFGFFSWLGYFQHRHFLLAVCRFRQCCSWVSPSFFLVVG